MNPTPERPVYRLTLEAMPSSGTPISRLKRALKTLAWYRLRVRRCEEVQADGPKLPAPAPGEGKDAGLMIDASNIKATEPAPAPGEGKDGP
jgi:hypothetical protein